MKDQGYAVFVSDSVTGLPVAVFAYQDQAVRWAVENYGGRSRVEPFAWESRPVDPENASSPFYPFAAGSMFNPDKDDET